MLDLYLNRIHNRKHTKVLFPELDVMRLFHILDNASFKIIMMRGQVSSLDWMHRTSSKLIADIESMMAFDLTDNQLILKPIKPTRLRPHSYLKKKLEDTLFFLTSMFSKKEYKKFPKQVFVNHLYIILQTLKEIKNCNDPAVISICANHIHNFPSVIRHYNEEQYVFIWDGLFSFFKKVVESKNYHLIYLDEAWEQVFISIEKQGLTHINK